MPFQPKEFAPGLWRGPRPCGDEQWELIGRLGIKTIIDLSDPWRNMPFVDFNCTDIHIPMSSVFPPRFKDIEKVFGKIADREDYQRPIYIHCKDGVDRTGFVVARYRMWIQEWCKKRAAQEMIAMGNHWWLRWWTWFL